MPDRTAGSPDGLVAQMRPAPSPSPLVRLPGSLSGRRGNARAGLNALIELAGGKQPRGRPAGLLCDSPQVQDAVGRADAILNAGRAYRTAMITELWNTVAAGKETTLEQRACECFRIISAEYRRLNAHGCHEHVLDEDPPAGRDAPTVLAGVARSPRP